MQSTATTSRSDPDPRPRLLRKLHILGHRKGMDHDYLRDLAAGGYGISSLAELTTKQLRDFIQRLDVRSEDRPPIKDDPSLVTHHSSPRPRPRPRRGRPAEPGIARMITPKQRRFIETLKAQLNWNETVFRDWLRTHFECDSIESLGTSERASKAINTLIGYCRKKQRQGRK